ncbi:MAG TPA: response regulator, partial [Negativicutes bacterium]|nr:response regulator [Negativicutes bacterium]
MNKEQKLRPQSETDRLLCRVRILYIEDDIGLGRLMQKRLERMVYMVDVAQDGQEGLNRFANGSYDVVITDYSMPIVNGLEVLQELKDLTPVIILTGQGDEKVAVTAMKLGAADYVTKDTAGDYIELLPSIIDRVMERQQLISDRRQARTELRASEERYRAIVEDQTEMICRVQPGGQLTFANGAFCRYFGIRPTDIAFQDLATLLSKKTYQDMKGILKTLTRQTPVKMIFHSLKMADGKVSSLEWTCRAIFDDSSKLGEYQLVGRDITELKRIEEALRESEARNSALLSAIPDPILRIEKNGNCVDIRSKKNHTLELSADFIGKNITEFF